MVLYCAENSSITFTPRRVQAILVPVSHDASASSDLDAAIKRVANTYYHSQLQVVLPDLRDGDTFLARRGKKRHGGQFDDVCFVADDKKRSHSTIILNGLRALEDEGYSIIALSAARFGNHRGLSDTDREELAREIRRAFEDFMKFHPSSTMEIVVTLECSEQDFRQFQLHLHQY